MLITQKISHYKLAYKRSTGQDPSVVVMHHSVLRSFMRELVGNSAPFGALRDEIESSTDDGLSDMVRLRHMEILGMKVIITKKQSMSMKKSPHNYLEVF